MKKKYSICATVIGNVLCCNCVYNKEELEKIIDFSDIEKQNLYVNIIHFDKNLKNKENIEYYRYLSVKTVGSYYPFNDFDMIKLFLSKLYNQIPYCHYILITSGSESKQILEEFHKFHFLTDIIIFCFNKNKYLNLLNNQYKKLKLITDDFKELIKFIESIKFSEIDLNLNYHLPLTPLITYYVYKKNLFPVHRILAYFFEEKFQGFSYEYFEISKKFLENSTLEEDVKNKIINIMKKLIDTEDFPEKCIEYYTGEDLCYVFNKALRNFEKYYLEMTYFIGPFYYGIFLYSLIHKEKLLQKKTKLYRDLKMNRLDLYLYQFCEKDIICFPSFTSTTLDVNLNFEITDNGEKINIDKIEEQGFVKMIITYDPKENSIPQGLDISSESQFTGEKEVLLFPFTFLRIDKVEIHSGKENDKHLIYMTIINKGDVLEYGLKGRYAFKLVENGTKIIIDKENNSSCSNNELYYETAIQSEFEPYKEVQEVNPSMLLKNEKAKQIMFNKNSILNAYIDWDYECQICFSQSSEIYIIPCEHICFCSDCFNNSKNKINKCSICGKGIENINYIIKL